MNERLFGRHARSAGDFQGLGAYLQQHLPPRFAAPGEVIAYSDYCSSIAGNVIERISGTRLRIVHISGLM